MILSYSFKGQIFAFSMKFGQSSVYWCKCSIMWEAMLAESLLDSLDNKNEVLRQTLWVQNK